MREFEHHEFEGPPFEPPPPHHHHHHWHCGPPGWPLWMPQVRGLLHVAILKLLKEQPLHGSEIQRVLKERFGLEVSGPAVYGALKKLEAFGFVVATWDTSGSGPARRVYRITEEGLDYLQKVTEKLVKLKEFVEKLVA
ncbi:MAG: PadR family transcriptional regulator [Thermofilum sp.]|jgi:DNA-binding PadR family transcriptional regulator|nr:PadR family transcriptional regulator [Thermofilum sp.]MCC6066052.1 PadR family transcriptional regulator [Thermofilum sp.]